MSILLNIGIVLFGLICLIASVVEYFTGHVDKAIYLICVTILMRVCTIAPTLPKD